MKNIQVIILFNGYDRNSYRCKNNEYVLSMNIKDEKERAK
jgi:hypothetical protein